MGADLTVSEQTDFRVDKKGRMQYTVTELTNFRPYAHEIIDYVGELSELSNCSTMTVDAVDFLEAVSNMEEMLLCIEHDGERFPNQKENLQGATQALKDFLEENDIQEGIERSERTFEVHLWY